jgi:hypothetical protein
MNIDYQAFRARLEALRADVDALLAELPSSPSFEAQAAELGIELDAYGNVVDPNYAPEGMEWVTTSTVQELRPIKPYTPNFVLVPPVSEDEIGGFEVEGETLIESIEDPEHADDLDDGEWRDPPIVNPETDGDWPGVYEPLRSIPDWQAKLAGCMAYLDVTPRQPSAIARWVEAHEPTRSKFKTREAQLLMIYLAKIRRAYYRSGAGYEIGSVF